MHVSSMNGTFVLITFTSLSTSPSRPSVMALVISFDSSFSVWQTKIHTHNVVINCAFCIIVFYRWVTEAL